MNEPFSIVIQANNASELEKLPNIRQVLILCHIMNTIRSSQRALLLVSEQPSSPAKERDTVFGLISASAYVYEGMTTVYQVFKKLGVNLPKELQAQFVWMHSEVITDKKSFYNSILDPIRNKITFHFSTTLASEPFATSIEIFPPVLASGSSQTSFHCAYRLPDDLLTKYLASLSNSTDVPKVKLAKLVQQLAEYNNRFCDILDNAIALLVEKYSELRVLPPENNHAAV